MNGHVGLIEDDVLVRSALKDCLESADYSVDVFGSAEEFLASPRDSHTVCLIVDVQLPGVTGLELQARLSGTGIDFPIIFLTAHPTDQHQKRAAQQGAAGFLSKPVRRDELLKAVKAAIRR